jgi:hypothetical protein
LTVVVLRHEGIFVIVELVVHLESWTHDRPFVLAVHLEDRLVVPLEDRLAVHFEDRLAVHFEDHLEVPLERGAPLVMSGQVVSERGVHFLHAMDRAFVVVHLDSVKPHGLEPVVPIALKVALL